jgi:hypothetical protein
MRVFKRLGSQVPQHRAQSVMGRRTENLARIQGIERAKKQEDRVVVAQLDRACACGVDRTANAANFNPMNGGACLRPDRHLSSMGTCSPCRTVNKAVTDFRNPCLLAAIANHAHRQDKGWGGGRFLGL